MKNLVPSFEQSRRLRDLGYNVPSEYVYLEIMTSTSRTNFLSKYDEHIQFLTSADASTVSLIQDYSEFAIEGERTLLFAPTLQELMLAIGMLYDSDISKFLDLVSNNFYDKEALFNSLIDYYESLVAI